MVLTIGDTLPEVRSPEIDRMRIAYMAVSMRDPNLVHIEDSYAARAGLSGVIAHGTFVTAYAGAAVSRVVGAEAIQELRIALLAPVFPGDQLRTEARVSDEVAGADGTTRLTIEIVVVRAADGAKVGKGTAVVTQ